MRVPAFLCLILTLFVSAQDRAFAWSWRSLLGGDNTVPSQVRTADPFQGKIFMSTTGSGVYLDYLQFQSNKIVEWYGYNFEKDLPELRSSATYRVNTQENRLTVYLVNGDHKDYTFAFSRHLLNLETENSTDEYCEIPQPPFWLDKDGPYGKASGVDKLRFAQNFISSIDGKRPERAASATDSTPIKTTESTQGDMDTPTVASLPENGPDLASSNSVTSSSGNLLFGNFLGEMTDMDGNSSNPFELTISAGGESTGSPPQISLEGSITIKSTGVKGTLAGRAVYGSQTTFVLSSKGTGGKAVFTGICANEALAGTWQFLDASGQIKK